MRLLPDTHIFLWAVADVRHAQRGAGRTAASAPFPSRLGSPADYGKLVAHIAENDMLRNPKESML